MILVSLSLGPSSGICFSHGKELPRSSAIKQGNCMFLLNKNININMIWIIAYGSKNLSFLASFK